MKFVDFYQNHFQEVVKFLSFKLSNQSEAEDLAQNIFMKIYVNWDKVDPSKASPRTYLFRVVKNSLIDYHRINKTGKVFHVEHSEANDNAFYQKNLNTDNPIQTLIGNEYRENFKKVLNTLPILQKRCAILYFQGFKMKEIADELGTTTGTICPMIKHIRDKFKVVYGLA